MVELCSREVCFRACNCLDVIDKTLPLGEDLEVLDGSMKCQTHVK